jgi:trehalose/maltose transport system substrate-binding protein
MDKMIVRRSKPACNSYGTRMVSLALEVSRGFGWPARKRGGGMKKSRPRTRVAASVLALMSILSAGCSHRASTEPPTITFVTPGWAHALSGLNVGPDERLQEFTRVTGVRVRRLPLPEGALDQLQVVRRGLLRQGPSSPDVAAIEVFWPGILSEQLTDLKPYLAAELSEMNPDVVASYTVNGKLVAVPYRVDRGVLFYRKDLLREYGYPAPPQTWDQLETMAARIQQGERSKGRKDFWGFLWPGAAGEGLICNALEWQTSEGGGRIIEADGTISVNNPHAIRAWQRAAHWVGWISPPSVTSYEEWDAINAFLSGRAAFFRGWALLYFFGFAGKAADPEKFDISNVPGGSGGQAATFGGWGLGIPRSAVHPGEALKLVQFLVHWETQSEEARTKSGQAHADLFSIRKHESGEGVASGLSTVAGPKYERVINAYLSAVHRVLTRESKAADAAAALEQELVRITGFKTGPPRPEHGRSRHESANGGNDLETSRARLAGRRENAVAE